MSQSGLKLPGGALLGFNEFLKEKGYDPSNFELGYADEDCKKGDYCVVILNQLALTLLLEFWALKSERSKNN